MDIVGKPNSAVVFNGVSGSGKMHRIRKVACGMDLRICVFSPEELGTNKNQMSAVTALYSRDVTGKFPFVVFRNFRRIPKVFRSRLVKVLSSRGEKRRRNPVVICTDDMYDKYDGGVVTFLKRLPRVDFPVPAFLVKMDYVESFCAEHNLPLPSYKEVDRCSNFHILKTFLEELKSGNGGAEVSVRDPCCTADLFKNLRKVYTDRCVSETLFDRFGMNYVMDCIGENVPLTGTSEFLDCMSDWDIFEHKVPALAPWCVRSALMNTSGIHAPPRLVLPKKRKQHQEHVQWVRNSIASGTGSWLSVMDTLLVYDFAKKIGKAHVSVPDVGKDTESLINSQIKNKLLVL